MVRSVIQEVKMDTRNFDNDLSACQLDDAALEAANGGCMYCVELFKEFVKDTAKGALHAVADAANSVADKI
jgi:hypothetical protein